VSTITPHRMISNQRLAIIG
jgi:hypothetical protein